MTKKQTLTIEKLIESLKKFDPKTELRIALQTNEGYEFSANTGCVLMRNNETQKEFACIVMDYDKQAKNAATGQEKSYPVMILEFEP